MRFRWTRVIAVGVAGAAVVIAAETYFAARGAKPLLFPLSDVLWVRDASGDYHRPGSRLSLEYVQLLRSRDLAVDSPKYGPFILLNAGVE